MEENMIGDRNLARLYMYRFLQLVTTYPDRALLETLKSKELWESLARAEEMLSVGRQDTIQGLSIWIKSYEDEGMLLKDLQIEYTYLFINAVPHVPAPPYESAYTDRGLLMGEPVSQVLQAYRKAGLNLRLDHDNLPDHIATEIEFMFYLVQQEFKQDNVDDNSVCNTWQERQKCFLEEHLARWSPLFFSNVVSYSRKDFYRLVAQLCEGFLNTETSEVTIK